MADTCEAEDRSEPECINWSVEEVAEWIESLGFEEYKVVIGLLCYFLRV